MTRVLTGPQKVGVLLVQLGIERSAPVLRSLREAEVTEVMTEVARLQEIDRETAERVVEEFLVLVDARSQVRSGGVDTARQLLERSHGTSKAQQVIDQISSSMAEVPFESIRGGDPKQVLGFIEDEHPQTIALVLAHLTPDRAAQILGDLADGRQREVAQRLAIMDRTSPDAVEQVEEVLARRMSTVIAPTDLRPSGGVQALVDILNRSDRATERLILEGLEQDDSELADEVRQRMFVFEDIVGLEDRSVQLVLRQVDTKELAVALKGVRTEVKEKITRNMSQRAGEMLLEEIDLLGPVRLKQVEEAQGVVVRVIRSLEESGQLVLSRSADEFVV